MHILFRFALALVFILFAIASAAGEPLTGAISPGESCPVKFDIEETLMLPRDDGVSLIMVPKEDTVMFAEYGPQSNTYTKRTAVLGVKAGETVKFSLEGLEQNSRNYYRVQCRRAVSRPSNFLPRKEFSFKTLRTENQIFSFAYAADPHIYQDWANFTCGTGTTQDGIKYFLASIGNILKADPDFMVIGGDFAHTQCTSCAQCTVGGKNYGKGTVQSQQEAELRYQKVFSKQFFGKITHTTPFIYVLGNHEGEQGFGDADGTCGIFDTTKQYSENARLKYFENPYNVYGGDQPGGYYSFETGDALIVVLDIMRYTTVYPKSPNDWALGTAQLKWLEDTLRSSDKKWKFVFAEHLVGGEPEFGPGGGGCYYYGRGGLRATDNDLPSGVFKGEQDLIHNLMKQYGAQFFLNGHDHVAVIGEKQNSNLQGEGIYYVKGGQMGKKSSGSWVNDPGFQKEMDWDLDGIADYFTDVTGSLRRGYFKITVNGKKSVTFDYIESNFSDPTLNNKVVFSKTVYGNTLPFGSVK